MAAPVLSHWMEPWERERPWRTHFHSPENSLQAARARANHSLWLPEVAPEVPVVPTPGLGVL